MSELADKIRSIGVIGKRTQAVNSKDKALSADRDAYRRLRQEGLQPPSVDGCAQLEKEAVTKDEIQTGAVRLPVDRRQDVARERREAMQRAQD